MNYPAFYDAVEAITLHDPLSEALGAFEAGMVEWRYVDVVKCAGHSCPTIAGAYLMVREGLKALYKDEIPERGAIKVSFRMPENEGTTGVVANVFSLVTGATSTWGFKGIGSQFNRTGLMAFEHVFPAHVKMQRIDTQACVELTYDPSSIPPAQEMQPLFSKLLTQSLTQEEKKLFAQLWQERVRKILENFDRVIALKVY